MYVNNLLISQIIENRNKIGYMDVRCSYYCDTRRVLLSQYNILLYLLT